VTVVPAKTVTTKKCAYVTLVMIGDEYIPGACVLAYSLKLVHVKADLVVMVTPDVSEKGRAILASIFDKVLEVPYIEAKSHQKRWGRFTDQGMYQWIDKSFTKFNCINLTQYDRIVMFDADMLALRNPDNLFDMAPPAGICTGVSMKAEEREPDETDWHGRQIASERGGSKILEDSLYHWGIRGCLYVLKPGANAFQDLKKQLASGEYGDKNLRPGADEQLLTNFYWKYWHHVHARFARVSYINKTELRGLPVMIHSPTIKPWNRPKTNQWKSENWLDMSMWCEIASKMAKKYPETAKCLKLEWVEEARNEMFQNQSLKTMYEIMTEEWTTRNETFINPVKQIPRLSTQVPEKVIWIFWNDKVLPPLVQLCKKSFERFNPGWKIFVVGPHNIFDFLYPTDLPDLWTELGRPAHQSDAARVALLCRYGGVYTDATVICLKPLEDIWDKIQQGDAHFWGFQYQGRPKTHAERMCCWFMASRRGFSLMYEWKEEIIRQMKGRKNTRKFYGNPAKCYVALGPPIIDPLVDAHPEKFALMNPIPNALIELDNVMWFLKEAQGDVMKNILENPVLKLFHCGGKMLNWSEKEILASNNFVGKTLSSVFTINENNI